jgi:hypothetical protein
MRNFWIGFGVGVVLVPVTTLGLVLPYIGEIGKAILFVPRWLTELLIDTQTAPGGLSLGLLALLSGLFFGGLGYCADMLRKGKTEDTSGAPKA